MEEVKGSNPFRSTKLISITPPLISRTPFWEAVILSNMAFEQYHEPAGELSQDVRTFARMIMNLIEEAEAIDWYEQRISLEKDKDAKAIMHNAQKEEFKHFGMNLEFLLRKKPEWREILKLILFRDGDIVEHGEEAEKASD